MWALSGPATAAILTGLSVLMVLYLGLGAKEPSFFLQLLIQCGIFIFMVFYLYEVQKKNNDKELVKEKLAEEIHLIDEEKRKKLALAEALEVKIHRFLDLQHFSKELKAVKGLAGVAQKIVDEARSVFVKADECALYLVDEAQQRLWLVASDRRDGESVREKGGTVFDLWAMKRYRAIVVEDSRNDFRFPVEATPGVDHLRSICVSPLMTENKVLGVIRVSSAREGAFNADDLRLLDILSNLGAVNLRNTLLYEKMQELALKDSLTGLFLNRYFQARLSEEIARSQGNGAAFSLLLLDIDFFKRYNDEYGHSAGDLVLKSIAGVLTKCLSPTDLAARYGGEEFVVLLPNRTKKEAMRIAERIRAEIEANRLTLRRVESRVTASFGVAAYPEDGRSRDELIWCVDRRLYEAKNKGRNRVCGSI